MFDFLGSPYTGGGLRMNPQQYYSDGIGLRPQTPMMTQGEGLTMASMPSDFGSMTGAGGANMQGLMMASKLLGASQPQETPIAKNNIPLGSNMSYQDIMKMYGLQGLMG